MNKRGWLASGLLAAAVIGGYLGLLPLLSSLASGPAWPEPIATRDASGVVTASEPLANDEPNEAPAVDEATTDVPEIVNDVPTTPAENDGAKPDVAPSEPKAVVVRVEGGLERIKRQEPVQRANGGGGSSGGGSSGGSPGGSSGGGGVTPPSLDGIGGGTLAGGGQATPGDDDIEAGG